jgi:hypothetical protein
MPAKPSMHVLVHRFQGKYDCGCPAVWDGPESCEIHGSAKMYLLENVGTFDAEITEEG